ncbi:Hemolysin, contains CBS domains [Lishizhenia tianjinensis]|uniref:Hemolysin, contains CBS domains n=1 Tax=Lishizhenia tianjinensis TaxID=477690 RepID=A0A1I7BE93_9FLAO|nr:hemolysin family protein [Lishizhenia tianjinensis]SFT85519.1 Hemolysin, contains CBS domains [Lishizhenia tianjinensis]
MESYTIFFIIGTLIASAFFSGMEIAFVSANKLKIELDRTKGNISGKILGRFVQYDANFIAAMLLGNNIALVIYGIQMAKLIEAPLEAMMGESGWVLLVQTIVSTLLILVTAEFLPKAIFQINPNRILKFAAIPLAIIYYLLFIPTQFTMLLSNGLLRLFRVKTDNGSNVFSKVDLDHYVRDLNERMEDEDELGNEMQILQNALNFGNVKARDCMIPRTEIVAVDVEDDIQHLSELFIETGLSKILIYRDNIDNVIGYSHSFELFKHPKRIKDILIPISFVPEAVPGKELLELFTKQQGNIAVVVDEFGGTSGVVTIEDVIEEIFGDIEDEHDADELLEEKIDDYTYRFSARTDIDWLNEKYDFELEESAEYETLGGLILNKIASIPEEGDEVETDHYKFVIEEVSDRRIEVVRIEIKD